MSELAQKIGKMDSKIQAKSAITPNNQDAAKVQKAGRQTQAVRDITREQWFWDTAVLS